MVFVSSLYVIHDAICFSKHIGPVGTEETTALKQASEWGMIGLQSSCPRVKERFMYEEYGERFDVANCCTLR
jgi:hypothetical protein